MLWDFTYLFHVWQEVIAVLLGAHHVVAAMADGFGDIELLLMLEWTSKEGSGRIKGCILELAWDAVASNLEKTGGKTSRANSLDDFLAFTRSWIFDKRSDVDSGHKPSSGNGISSNRHIEIVRALRRIGR